MRLLIAERSQILRKRITGLFSDLGYFSLVAFEEDLEELQKIAKEVNPDVIVIDIGFPNPHNLKMIAGLKGEIRHPKIIILTETSEPLHIRQFQESGAGIVFNKKDELSKFIGLLNLMDSPNIKTSAQ